MSKTSKPIYGSRRTAASGMTPEQRRLRAQLAANALWSKYMARGD